MVYYFPSMTKLKDLPVFPLLGIVIFFILGAVVGGMFVKIQYLESGKAPTAVAPTQPSAPTQPQAPTKVEVKVLPTDPVRGNPNAKLTIVNFSDYKCSYCARFHQDALPQILKDYVDTGKAKYVFKNLAFLGPESIDAANAAKCAQEQNKFWDYYDKLFTSQSESFTNEKLKSYAVGLGLNASQFNDCLDKKKYNDQVTADNAEASKNGFQSTPSTAVGTTPIVGAQPYEQFKTAIEAELSK